MATITRRGPRTFEVEIRRKGFGRVSATFRDRVDAEVWARETEAEMLRGTYQSRREIDRTTLAAALDRYAREITPDKKGWKRESNRIRALSRDPLAAQPLSAITGMVLAAYRDTRLTEVSPSTVQKELALISHVFTIAAREWGMPVQNPVQNIRKPRVANARDRRVTEPELRALLDLADLQMRAWIVVAVETAMRRGEMAALQRSWIRGAVIRLPDSKNGSVRSVPLSSRARQAIADLPVQMSGRVFGIGDNQASKRFASLCRKAGIDGLRLHDLRHEATSRLFEAGLSISEVASITGHKTWAMLARYTHHEAERLASLLG